MQSVSRSFFLCRSKWVVSALLLAVLVLPCGLHAQPAGEVGRLKAQLGEAVEEARAFPEHEYDIPTWTRMRLDAESARRVERRDDATREELADAYRGLRESVRALKRRRDASYDGPAVALSASLFAARRDGPVNNVALMWATAEPCERFEVHRATSEDGPFEPVYRGGGRSFHDVGLPEGTYFYRLHARVGGKRLVSNVAQVSTMPMPAGLNMFSNETGDGDDLSRPPIKVGDTFYRFRTERDGPALKHVMMFSSTDGRNWSDGEVVMDRSSHPDLADFKFESGSRFYDQKNDQIVWWCHWELSGPRYGDGKAMVATAKPGGPFTVHRIYNPLGIQVRDMSIFVDDDGRGYLVAASNVPGQGANATIYVFRLNDTFTDVEEIVAKVVENGYREAPHIVKDGGFYYLFFSQAAGWYPSRGGYVVSKSIEGPWSEARAVGNSSTYSSQSGPVYEFGDVEPVTRVFTGYRWIRGEGTSGKVVMPIDLADGFAFYDYAPELLHGRERGLVLPLQFGRLLSQGKPAEASISGKDGHGAERAFDGDYDTMFQSDDRQWPFELGVDLGEPCAVRNVQISWYIHKGSEAFYRYTIEGSVDGKDWAVIVDRTDTEDTVVNKTYGFTSDVVEDADPVRFVRVNVRRAHLHNNPNNWYPPTIYEVKVYGQAVGERSD